MPDLSFIYYLFPTNYNVYRQVSMEKDNGRILWGLNLHILWLDSKLQIVLFTYPKCLKSLSELLFVDCLCVCPFVCLYIYFELCVLCFKPFAKYNNNKNIQEITFINNVFVLYIHVTDFVFHLSTSFLLHSFQCTFALQSGANIWLASRFLSFSFVFPPLGGYITNYNSVTLLKIGL